MAPTRKVCLVVGAGDATGGAVARRFAREGYVTCVTRRTADKLEPLLLSVDRAGTMYLNLGDPKQALSEERVLEVASAALRREPERPVLVKADRAVAYGRVVEGMVLLQQAGARKVGFVTEPVSAGREQGSR